MAEHPSYNDAHIEAHYMGFVTRGSDTTGHSYDSLSASIATSRQLLADYSDDEALIAFQLESENELSASYLTDSRLEVDEARVSLSLDELITVFIAQDSEGLGVVRERMGIEDADIWQAMLQNLEERTIPLFVAESSPDELAAAATAVEKAVFEGIELIPVDPRQRLLDSLLTVYPEPSDEQQKRTQLMEETCEDIDNAINALPFLDPERATILYQRVLLDRTLPDSVISSYITGLNSFFYADPERGLEVSGKALNHQEARTQEEISATLKGILGSDHYELSPQIVREMGDLVVNEGTESD